MSVVTLSEEWPEMPGNLISYAPTLACERQRDRPAEAAPATGDEAGATFEACAFRH